MTMRYRQAFHLRHVGHFTDLGGHAMKTARTLISMCALAVAALGSGCATWDDMDRSERGLAAGATGGAVVGGVLGGPIGAAIGAGVGGYAGHHEAGN
jgi:hypothetical protein